mmetsp:Transcript_7999/g.22985  ORF Transcript_7999/g.22985 Transcript_7999/m.22985 type:complete len:126 (+) Transcript_7999:178-555(+)
MVPDLAQEALLEHELRVSHQCFQWNYSHYSEPRKLWLDLRFHNRLAASYRHQEYAPCTPSVDDLPQVPTCSPESVFLWHPQCSWKELRPQNDLRSTSERSMTKLMTSTWSGRSFTRNHDKYKLWN